MPHRRDGLSSLLQGCTGGPKAPPYDQIACQRRRRDLAVAVAASGSSSLARAAGFFLPSI